MESIEVINKLLRDAASKSTCEKRHIASVLMLPDGKTFITGHNGPIMCFEDYCIECPRMNSETGMDMDKCPAIHAEVSPILYAARYGIAVIGSTLFINCGLPCKDCMKEIIAAGIRKIVSPFPLETYDRQDGFASGCTYNFPLAAKMMRECGVEYIHEPRLIRHK